MTHGGVKPLKGLPRKVDVPTYGKVDFGPLQEAHDLAKSYMGSINLPYNPISTYVKVDVKRAKRIATAYSEMVHAPNNFLVRNSYLAMARETIAQYHLLINKSGLKIELINGDIDPYRASPRLAIMDVVNNKHLWVFPTEIGFGTEPLSTEDNVLLQRTDEYINGKQLCINDVFRIVHDYFGHVKDGIGFRADGEENAWRSHAAMYSRLALGAITTELRGQNSWLNFGPYGEYNRTARAENTVYAPQKNGLLPEWTWDEGREDVKAKEHARSVAS